MEYELHVIVATKDDNEGWVWKDNHPIYGPVEFEHKTLRHEIISTFVAAGELPPFPYLTEIFRFSSMGKSIIFSDVQTGQPVLGLLLKTE